nr:uncharacterized protein LOC119179612 isoform X2 [Rhipicephalus microplus]
MGVLNIAVVAVVPLVFIVVLSHPESQKFECGPYCPEQGVTYNSCWTVCESSVNEGLDPFNTKNGRFRNGTPCWLSRSRTAKARDMGCCVGLKIADTKKESAVVESVSKTGQTIPARARCPSADSMSQYGRR